MSQIVTEYKDAFPSINKDKTKNHLQKLNKSNDVSKPTLSMEIDKTILLSNSNMGTISTITDSLQSNTSSNTPVLDDKSEKQLGRPKGTTKQQLQDIQDKVKLAFKKAADSYSEL
jgi:hypothetical protein